MPRTALAFAPATGHTVEFDHVVDKDGHMIIVGAALLALGLVLGVSSLPPPRHLVPPRVRRWCTAGPEMLGLRVVHQPRVDRDDSFTTPQGGWG